MTAFSRFIEEHGRTLYFIVVALGAITAVAIYFVQVDTFKFVHLIFLLPFGGIAGFGVLQIIVLLTGVAFAMPRLSLAVAVALAGLAILYLL